VDYSIASATGNQTEIHPPESTAIHMRPMALQQRFNRALTVLHLKVFAAVCYNIRYQSEAKNEIRRFASTVVRLRAPTGDLG